MPKWREIFGGALSGAGGLMSDLALRQMNSDMVEERQRRILEESERARAETASAGRFDTGVTDALTALLGGGSLADFNTTRGVLGELFGRDVPGVTLDPGQQLARILDPIQDASLMEDIPTTAASVRRAGDEGLLPQGPLGRTMTSFSDDYNIDQVPLVGLGGSEPSASRATLTDTGRSGWGDILGQIQEAGPAQMEHLQRADIRPVDITDPDTGAPGTTQVNLLGETVGDTLTTGPGSQRAGELAGQGELAKLLAGELSPGATEARVAQQNEINTGTQGSAAASAAAISAAQTTAATRAEINTRTEMMDQILANEARIFEQEQRQLVATSEREDEQERFLAAQETARAVTRDLAELERLWTIAKPHIQDLGYKGEELAEFRHTAEGLRSLIPKLGRGDIQPEILRFMDFRESIGAPFARMAGQVGALSDRDVTAAIGPLISIFDADIPGVEADKFDRQFAAVAAMGDLAKFDPSSLAPGQTIQEAVALIIDGHLENVRGGVGDPTGASPQPTDLTEEYMRETLRQSDSQGPPRGVGAGSSREPVQSQTPEQRATLRRRLQSMTPEQLDQWLADADRGGEPDRGGQPVGPPWPPSFRELTGMEGQDSTISPSPPDEPSPVGGQDADIIRQGLQRLISSGDSGIITEGVLRLLGIGGR